MKHRWVKAPTWWFCTLGVDGYHCGKPADVGCSVVHKVGAGSCDEGRCEKHAPRSTKTDARGTAK